MDESDTGPPEDQDDWVVTDTETTGMKEHDQVIEWGIVGPGHTWKVLFKPTVPIHCEARASHNITDKELKTASTFAEWLECNGEFKPFGTARYLVAHNAEFDLRLLKQTGLPAELLPEKTICTLICAKHIWPDAESFKNHALRYYFELQFTREEKKAMKLSDAHRVIYDTIITRALLRRMLETTSPTGKPYTLYQLAQLTKAPVLLKTCYLPKHVGVPWADVAIVDRNYLDWVFKKGITRIENGVSIGFHPDIIHTVQYYLNQAA